MKKSVILFVSIAVAIVVAAGVLVFFSANSTPAEEKDDPNFAKMPDVVGLPLEEAEALFQKEGLMLIPENVANASVKEGRVISQEIAPKEKVARDSQVKVKVSIGPTNIAGTTTSNASNHSRVTSQGDWLYYVSGEDEFIYRAKKDLTQKELICKRTATSLNVIGEWIYFTDYSIEDGGIYKVKTTGGAATRLSSDVSYHLYVYGDWIYYTDKFWGGKIYKMTTEGRSRTKLTSVDCDAFIVNGDYIYYVKDTDNDRAEDEQIYRCRIDGKGSHVPMVGLKGLNLTLAGDTFVVVDMYDLVTLDIDGRNLNSFGENNVQYFLINGYKGWLYYLELDHNKNVDTLGRMKPDGSQKTTIYEYDFVNTRGNAFLNVLDDYIYFSNGHDNYALYRVHIETSKVEKVG